MWEMMMESQWDEEKQGLGAKWGKKGIWKRHSP